MADERAESNAADATHATSPGLEAWSTSLAHSVSPVEIEHVVAAGIAPPAPDRAARRRLVAAASVGLIGASVVGAAVLVSDGDRPPAEPPPATAEDAEGPEPSTTSTAPSASTSASSQMPGVPPAPATIDEPLARASDGTSTSISHVTEYTSAPLFDIEISPSGRSIAINRDERVCVLDTRAAPRAEIECVDTERSVARDSLVWSPDESSLAFHDDLFALGQDPDIAVLDAPSGTIEILTEDDTDDADVGLVDVAPFFDAEGRLHFFRLSNEPLRASMFRFEPVGEATDLLVVDGIPTERRHDDVTGRIAAITQAPEHATPSLIAIDLDELNVEIVTPLVAARIVEVADGRTLVASAGDATAPVRFAVVELADGASLHALPGPASDSGRSITGAGLSPDGDEIVIIIEDRNDPTGHDLAIAPLLQGGALGEYVVIASGNEFAPNDGDPTIRPAGLGARREIAWTDDDRLIYGVGPDRIVTLDLQR